MSQDYQPGLSHHFYRFSSVYLIGNIVTLSIVYLFIYLFVCSFIMDLPWSQQQAAQRVYPRCVSWSHWWPTERPPARSFSEPHLLLIHLIFLLFPSDGTYPCSLSGDLAWVAKHLCEIISASLRLHSNDGLHGVER